MLVLSRKRGEKIVIGQSQISVTVLEIQGKRVRLGIAAPDNVDVHRQEIEREFHDERPDSNPSNDAVDPYATFAARMSDAAYQVALRQGLTSWWIDLELGMWKELTRTAREWNRSPSTVDTDECTSEAKTAPRPR